MLEALRSGRAREVLIAASARSTSGLDDVLEACAGAGLEPRRVARRELDALAVEHQGVVARIEVPNPIGERELSSWRFGEEDLVVVLDGVEDPQNLGAAARSAEAAGAAMLVTRLRRSADVTPAAVRASAGALLHLPHARVANLPRALERLQGAGFTVVGLDERAGRTVYEEGAPGGKLAVVVGAERKGLARLTREACDELVSLPMRGQVGSLNAAAALAAVLYSYVLPSRAARRLGTPPA